MITGSAQDATGEAGTPVIATGQYSVSRRSADGAGGMGVQEGNSFVCHLLQVRGFDLAIGVCRGDVTDSQVVGEYENYVGALVVVGVKKTAQE